jgi:Cu/Ag efflux pump CusA
MLPLVVLGEIAGLEIVHAIAVVILGGLLTATLFTLYVVPAVYLRYGRKTGIGFAEAARRVSRELKAEA